MGKRTPPATAWELEAARRQEVVASDFGTRPSQADTELGTRTMSRIAGLRSAVVRTINHAPTDSDAMVRQRTASGLEAATD
jgi:hypothetical protein